MMPYSGIPSRQGLYDPQMEHDACGVGLVAHVRGTRSHAIVQKALEVLENLEHRGAQGSEPNQGDGAGILLQIPHALLVDDGARHGISVPEEGSYGVGMFFFPNNEAALEDCTQVITDIIADEGLTVLGWRQVPTEDANLGEAARATEPTIQQLFVGRGDLVGDQDAFERKLYVVRRRAEKALGHHQEEGRPSFYCLSFSSRTIVYKGMLTSTQVRTYFPDLSDPRLESAFGIVHARFSTNTFPSWERAHPYRMVIHNGEINTLRGNLNWMRAREPLFESELFGEDLAKVRPVVDIDGSDTAVFDNTLEFLVHGGAVVSSCRHDDDSRTLGS